MIDPRLHDKVVLVTGGNNPYGIGAAIARAFASQGSKVFIHYFRQQTILADDGRDNANMQETGLPDIMDVTQSVHRPGGLGGKSGGDRKYVPDLALAACACGVKSFFFETHEEPEKALSDGPNMLEPAELEKLLVKLLKVREAIS